jgi:hypothetical protein
VIRLSAADKVALLGIVLSIFWGRIFDWPAEMSPGLGGTHGECSNWKGGLLGVVMQRDWQLRAAIHALW